MFNNVGEKIKGIAEFITWIGIIVSVIAGLAMMFALRGRGFVLGIIVAGIGSLVSWLSSITLYAFGQLVESTEENAEYNREILKILQEKQPEEKPVEKTVDAAPTEKLVTTVVCVACGASNSIRNGVCENCGASSLAENEMTCPVCNTRQRKGRRLCWRCGLEFATYQKEE